ncbi:MAG: hypothetical protein WKF76_05980 [Nocardioidaceae bacterium]
MKLTRRHAYLFLSIAIWNVVTYGVFTKNLAATDGRPTGYYVAHTVLIIVNLAIAGVLAFLGVRALRSPRTV